MTAVKGTFIIKICNFICLSGKNFIAGHFKSDHSSKLKEFFKQNVLFIHRWYQNSQASLLEGQKCPMLVQNGRCPIHVAI